MQNLTLIGHKKEIKDKAKTLTEGFSLLHEFIGETFVIKYSGSALNEPDLADSFVSDVIAMKQMGLKVIIIHGGSSKIDIMLEKFNLKNNLSEEDRSSTRPSIEVTEMIMSGLINKQIVANISNMGGAAVGISGKDCNLIEAKRVRRAKNISSSNIENIVDIGFMGEVISINPEFLLALEDTEIIPVITPIATGEQGETIRLKSDEVAAAIASSLAASKLIIIGDYPGFVHNNIIQRSLSISALEKMMRDKPIDTYLAKNASDN